MAAITQQQWSTLMIQQLRILDPSVSAFVGTPERKLIDTVASALANATIDLNALSNALNFDGKVGRDLDQFVGLFGFSRQGATYATGTAAFTGDPTTVDIAIPYGTQVAASVGATTILFDVVQPGVLAANTTSASCAIRCEISGSIGEIPANAINGFVGNNPIIGITGVTNPVATTGGNSLETDAALKVRFKNQCFRNVSGTSDQYLATALSASGVSKANCIGVLSRYREYLQVPDGDDNTVISVANGIGGQVPESGNGPAGQWTTALSTIPYSKYIYTSTPVFVSNGAMDSTTVFYQPGIDFRFNILAVLKNRGDAYRIFTAESTTLVSDPQGVTVMAGTPSSGIGPFIAGGTFYWKVTAFTANGETSASVEVSLVVTANGSAVLTWQPVDGAEGYNIYRATSPGAENVSPALVGTVFDPDTLSFHDIGYTAFTGALPASNTATFTAQVPDPTNSPFRPSVTFLNVYTGEDGTVMAARPGDIVLFEHAYISSESRNDLTRNVTNCVDVFVDGENQTSASATTAVPLVGVGVFGTNPVSSLYVENYRRVGEPEHRPVVGNIFQPVFWSPLLSLPATITAGGYTYQLGVHYFAVQEVDEIGGTAQARDGIEWNTTVYATPTDSATPVITANPGPTVVINNYTYDKNIVDLQAAFEGIKQATTSPLAHKAVIQYYKLDVTAMYAPGSNPATVNSAVQSALQTYFTGQYFGATIQMSTLLNIIHNVNGITNIRWTRDLDDTVDRIIVCDVNGHPLRTMQTDRLVSGTSIAPEHQQGYFVGGPDGGDFTLTFGGSTTPSIGYTPNIAYQTYLLNQALTAASIPATVTGGSGTPEDPFIFVFTADGFRAEIISCQANLLGGPYSINNDFFLLDSQLPSLPTAALPTDTVPGLIIRPRAQDVWLR